MRLSLGEAAATKKSRKWWSLLVSTNLCLVPVENADYDKIVTEQNLLFLVVYFFAYCVGMALFFLL